MKKSIKLLSLIMAIIISCAAITSCAVAPQEETTAPKAEQVESDDNAVTGEESESESEYVPEITSKNHNSDFYLSIMPDVNPVDYYWVKESENNALSDAIYVRQENVRKYLGVNIIGTATGNTDKYITPFKTAIKNKDDSVHMLVSHVFFGIEGFITENYLTDINEIPQINTEAPYWNQQFMEDLSIKGHYFLGFSDFNILYTNVVVFNKSILDLYKDTIEEDFYQLVTDYKWTLDKMIGIAKLVSADALSDGKTEDDMFGITGFLNVPVAPFIQACNMSIVEMDDKGAYKIAVYNEKNKQKMSTLVDKLSDLIASDSAWIKKNSPSCSKVFSESRTLMYLCSTYNLPAILQYGIDFGVLPYPMYDEAQKDVGYRSLQWGGYICIPSYLSNPDMVGETIEMLSYYSKDVNIAFYEKLLGKQVADSPKDRAMLDIVWDSVCSDFGQTYGSAMNTTVDFLFMLCNICEEGSTSNLASYMAKGESAANKGLKGFIAKVKN